MTIILQPVIALAAWTLVMFGWMYATRLPAMAAAKVNLDKLANDRNVSLEHLLEPKVQWKAHNYNHLHESPTVFYAVMLALALLSTQAAFDSSSEELVALLGWTYVTLRVLHSVVQAVWNKVMLRFILFSLSQVALIALTVMAVMAVFDL